MALAALFAVAAALAGLAPLAEAQWSDSSVGMGAGYTFAELTIGGSATDDDLPVFDTAKFDPVDEDRIGTAACKSAGAGIACADALTDGFLEVALRAPYPFVFDATATSAGGFPPSSDRAGIGAESSLVGTTPALPEAQTTIMLLAGLGLMIFVARRRSRNLAA